MYYNYTVFDFFLYKKKKKRILPPVLRGEAVLGAAQHGPLPAGVFAGQGVPLTATQGGCVEGRGVPTNVLLPSS